MSKLNVILSTNLPAAKKAEAQTGQAAPTGRVAEIWRIPKIFRRKEKSKNFATLSESFRMKCAGNFGKDPMFACDVRASR